MATKTIGQLSVISSLISTDVLEVEAVGASKQATIATLSDAVFSEIAISSTFTPTLTFSGASVGLTYSAQAGEFLKLGDWVFITARISLSDKGTSTGGSYIESLPYVPSGQSRSGSLRMSGVSFADFAQCVVLTSGQIQLEEITNAGGRTQLDQTNFVSTSTIYVSLMYQTS